MAEIYYVHQNAAAVEHPANFGCMSPEVRCLASDAIKPNVVLACLSLAIHRRPGSPKLSVTVVDSREQRSRRPIRLPWCVSGDHSGCEIREVLAVFRWAAVVRNHAQMLRCKTQCQCRAEFFDCLHLPVEPGFRIGTE